MPFYPHLQFYFAFNNSRELNTYFTACKGDDMIVDVNHTEDKLEDMKVLEELRGACAVYALADFRVALVNARVVFFLRGNYY